MGDADWDSSGGHHVVGSNSCRAHDLTTWLLYAVLAAGSNPYAVIYSLLSGKVGHIGHSKSGVRLVSLLPSSHISFQNQIGPFVVSYSQGAEQTCSKQSFFLCTWHKQGLLDALIQFCVVSFLLVAEIILDLFSPAVERESRVRRTKRRLRSTSYIYYRSRCCSQVYDACTSLNISWPRRDTP